MAKGYDWVALRARYVTGKESLRDLAADDSTPTLTSLMRHSAAENWPQAREEYKRRVGEKAESEAAQAAADVIANQLSLGTWMRKTGGLVLQGMVQNAIQTIMGPGGRIDPSRLTPKTMADAGISATRMLELVSMGIGIEQSVLKSEEQVTIRVARELDTVLEVVKESVDPETFAAILKRLDQDAPL